MPGQVHNENAVPHAVDPVTITSLSLVDPNVYNSFIQDNARRLPWDVSEELVGEKFAI